MLTARASQFGMVVTGVSPAHDAERAKVPASDCRPGWSDVVKFRNFRMTFGLSLLLSII